MLLDPICSNIHFSTLNFYFPISFQFDNFLNSILVVTFDNVLKGSLSSSANSYISDFILSGKLFMNNENIKVTRIDL